VNDAARLCRDSGDALGGGGRAITGVCRLASQMGRFETKWLSRPENLAALADLPGQWIRQGSRAATARIVVLRHGFERKPNLRRAGRSAYNGHFGLHLLPPLFVFTSWAIWRDAPCGRQRAHADGWRRCWKPGSPATGA